MIKTRKNTLIIHLLDDRLRFLAGRSSLWSFDLSGFTDFQVNLRLEAGGKDLSNRLFKELERFILEHSLRNPRVIVAVSRSLLTWRYFKVPPVPPQELDRLVAFEVEKHLPVKREEIFFRHLPVEQTHDGWIILLAGTRKDFLQGVGESLEMMGLRPAMVMPDLWGLFNLFRHMGQRFDEGLQAVASLEARGVELAVMKDNLPIYYRRATLPDIDEEGPDSASERISRRVDFAAEAIISALREADSSLSLGGKLGKGYLAAEGAGGDMVAQKLAESPVKQWQVVKPSEVALLKGRADLDDHPRILTTAGLALSADEASRCPVNLMPTTEALRARKVGFKLTAALLLLFLASVGGYFGSGFWDRQNRIEDLDREINGLRKQVAAVRALNDSLNVQEAKLHAFADLTTKKVTILNILKELTVIIPKNAYLSQMTLKKNSVELTGFADSASVLISALEESALFKNVSFDAPITSQGQQKERFKIKMALE